MLDEEQYWADGATRNCVWLFQTKRRDYNDRGCICDAEFDEEGGYIEGTPACQCYVDVWDTEVVFLTRKEGDAYGERRPYAWGKKNEGWRLYGVPCDGMMTDLLGRHVKEFEKHVEYITESNNKVRKASNVAKCLMCGSETEMVVNSRLKAKPICNPCSLTIMAQTATWCVEQHNKKRTKEVGE